MPTLTDEDFRRMQEAGFVGAHERCGDDATVLGMSVAAIEPGQMLFNEGEPAVAFYFVLSGWVVLFREAADGARVAIHLFGPGDSFGEALIEEGRIYPGSAEAATAASLVRVDCARFRKRLIADPRLALSLVAGTFTKSKVLLDRILQDQTWSPQRRVAAFLCRFCSAARGECRFELPVEQRYIAARLSMTASTLSRALSELAAVGVEANRGRILIRDIAKLRRFASPGSGEDPS